MDEVIQLAPVIPEILDSDTGEYIVRLWDGGEYLWIDVSGKISKEEAVELWNEFTENGSKNIHYEDFDYYAIFPAYTEMLYSE